MRGAALAGAKDPPNCLETSGVVLAGRECSSFGGERQEAGSKSGATARRGNPEQRPREGPARRERREPGSTWLSRGAAARLTQRSASELCASRERDPPGASCWQIREPSALLKFCVGREGCKETKKGIQDTSLELCLVCCAADTLQVHFPFGAKGQGFDDTDGRSGLEFSPARIKDYNEALL